jgi:hypothetical protein
MAAAQLGELWNSLRKLQKEKKGSPGPSNPL